MLQKAELNSIIVSLWCTTVTHKVKNGANIISKQTTLLKTFVSVLGRWTNTGNVQYHTGLAAIENALNNRRTRIKNR